MSDCKTIVYEEEKNESAITQSPQYLLFVENSFLVSVGHMKLISFMIEVLIWPPREEGSESLKIFSILKLSTFKLILLHD